MAQFFVYIAKFFLSRMYFFERKWNKPKDTVSVYKTGALNSICIYKILQWPQR